MGQVSGPKPENHQDWERGAAECDQTESDPIFSDLFCRSVIVKTAKAKKFSAGLVTLQKDVEWWWSLGFKIWLQSIHSYLPGEIEHWSLM